jgi:hypothetical protein
MRCHLQNINKVSFQKLLNEATPLLCILTGVVLVYISIGPFHNPDTQLEYEAASVVFRWGRPYLMSSGKLINQPPLGFYVAALFFKGVGLSYDIGVSLVTLFGLGCTVLVYEIGKVLYAKSTGLFAAALFALTPWQIVLSRSFLIDVQCLFFSLLFMFVGIYSIRKDSLAFFMVSGTFFAIAFLTKFFAIFTLIPLAIFYICYRKEKLSRKFSVLMYFLPAFSLFFLWYQVISGEGWFSAFVHEDFWSFNPAGAVPSYFFVGNFLSYSLGALFVIGAVLSLLVCILHRKFFAKILPFDLMCLITIVAVGSVNTFLGVGLNLRPPYINPIKYDYQFLPFFSLLAASLVGKCLSLYNSVKSSKLDGMIFSVAIVGLVLLVVSMFLNVIYVHQVSMMDYLLFRVERDTNVGYSFENSMPIEEYSYLIYIQIFGFALVLAGLVWASRGKFGWVRKLLYR